MSLIRFKYNLYIIYNFIDCHAAIYAVVELAYMSSIYIASDYLNCAISKLSDNIYNKNNHDIDIYENSKSSCISNIISYYVDFIYATVHSMIF